MFKLKSVDYGAITIEFVNCLSTKFNGDILFELLPIYHPLGHFRQLQGMDWKFDGHAWCKLQASNIKNSFGLGFIMTKCLGNLCCYNDFYLIFQHSSACNMVSWNGDSLHLRYLGNVLWNPQYVPWVLSSMIFQPPIYKLAVVECIVLFRSFQFFQKSQSNWAPMPI